VEVSYFYHLALVGSWKIVLAHSLSHLRGRKVHIGIVGDLSPAADKVIADIAASNTVELEICVTSPDLLAYEIPTLEALQDSKADVVFYSHSKGVSHRHGLPSKWAEYMYRGCIANESRVLHALASECRTAGVLWTTDLAQPYRDQSKPVSYYAGNFWYSRTDYLRTLPRIRQYFRDTYASSRFTAELWIGHGDPKPLMLDGRHFTSVSEIWDQIGRSRLPGFDGHGAPNTQGTPRSGTQIFGRLGDD